MVRQGQISDEFWAVVEPLLPSSEGRRGRPWADHRQMLEGISWRYRTGSPWRDLPADFGPWQTVWKRHFRWSTDGTYQQIMDAVIPKLGMNFGVTVCAEDVRESKPAPEPYLRAAAKKRGQCLNRADWSAALESEEPE